MTDEEIEHDEVIPQKIFEAEMNDDKAEADRLRELLTPIGPMTTLPFLFITVFCSIMICLLLRPVNFSSVFSFMMLLIRY